jgi:hypothetical protein
MAGTICDCLQANHHCMSGGTSPTKTTDRRSVYEEKNR